MGEEKQIFQMQTTQYESLGYLGTHFYSVTGLSVPFFSSIKKGTKISLLYKGIGKQFQFSGYFEPILMILLSLLDGHICQWADERNYDE